MREKGDVGARLFHTIVVMGLSFGGGACGGQIGETASTDAGPDGPGAFDATARSSDATESSDVTSASEAASTSDAAADSALAGEAGDAGVAPDAYGHPDDAGNCVCPPGSRQFPGPCCPPGYPVCSPWPCYV
jgi:hypothetical protein